MSEPQRRIVLASNNAGKVREVGQILAGLDLEVVSQAEFLVPEAEETGQSFVENAIIKARNAALYTRLPAIADDSGLEVDALQGAPGVRSARYAGPRAGDLANLELLLKSLAETPAQLRGARFQCLMVYLRHAEDPTPLICQGTWEGRIAEQPKGDNGFGYDPVFWVPERNCTAAELPAEIKNRLSHRGQALRCLVRALGQEPVGA
jgi:XTP/dITP diphosphohydrolase